MKTWRGDEGRLLFSDGFFLFSKQILMLKISLLSSLHFSALALESVGSLLINSALEPTHAETANRTDEAVA
jgi:hypothetical protein